MKVITQREFCNNATAVINAVESGETYRVARNGVEMAELLPIPRRGSFTAEELVKRHRKLPRVDAAQMREEADVFFGDKDGAAIDDS